MSKTTETAHSIFSNGLLMLLMIPIAFGQWLLCNGEFGPGKAIIFIICMFLFGSIFFFN